MEERKDFQETKQNIKSKAQETAQQARAKGEETFERAKEMAEEKWEDATDSAGSTWDTVANRGQSVLSALKDYVQDKPLQAMGITLALGFILGSISFSSDSE